MPTVQNNQSGDDDGRVIYCFYCLVTIDYSTSTPVVVGALVVAPKEGVCV